MLELLSGLEAMSVRWLTSSIKMSDTEHATEEMNSLSGRAECETLLQEMPTNGM